MRSAFLLALIVTLTPLSQACGGDDDVGAPPDGGGPVPDGAVILDDAGNPVLDDAGNPIPVPDAQILPDASPATAVITACASGGDYPTIQAAIDAAPEGARVEVCAGTYHEHVLLAKGIELAAVGDVVIDGSGNGVPLRVSGVGGAGARVSGFTLTHGRAGDLGGGGLLVQDSLLDASALDIHDNLSASRGGGVAILGGTVTLRDSAVRANHANDRAGGLYVASNALLQRVTIDGNSAGGKGGGFYFDVSSPTLRGSTISSNTSLADGAGGGTYMSHAIIEDNVFMGNQASLDDAGAIRVHLSQAVIRNNQFIGNVAADNGGGIKVSHDRSEITDNLFEGNSGRAGGGLDVDDDQSHVARNTFRNNTADLGAGMHAANLGSPGLFEDNLFDGNVATLRGGGIYIEANFPTGVVTVLRSTFTGNAAERGASVGVSGSPFVVSNSILTGGTAVSGGAFYVVGGATGTFSFLVAVDNGGATSTFRVIDSTVTVTSSILEGDVRIDGTSPAWRHNDLFPIGAFVGMSDPTGSDGNVSIDPALTADWHLPAGSPLIDSGDPEFTDRDGSPADIGLYGGPDAP